MDSLLDAARRQKRELERRVAIAEAQAAAALGSLVRRGQAEFENARQERRAFHPGRPAPMPRQPVSPAGVRADGRRQTPPSGSPDHPLAFLDRNPVVKYLAGVSATIPTAPLGAVRGALNMVGDAIALERFRQRLADPLDRWKSPPGESAREQLARTAGAAKDYVARGLRHPEDVVDDAADAAGRTFDSVNPWEAAQADSIKDALLVGAHKGLNQGELAFNVVGPVKGARVLTAARPLSYTERVERFVRKGSSPVEAERLAELYDGMGHHYIPRRVLKALGIPDIIGNSPFNVRKPTGISKGDFYVDHYKSDLSFHGARLRGRRGKGSGWSGKRLGLRKYGPLGRIVLGAPEALQDTVGSALSGTEGAIADALHRNEVD